MDGRQWLLEGIDLATDDLSKVKAAVAAQTGIHEDNIIFENGYDPEGRGDQVRYDPEVYLPRCANGLTELRVVADPQRGEIFRAMRRFDETTIRENRMEWYEFLKWRIQINNYLASNLYDIEILLNAVKKSSFTIGYNIKCFPASITDDLMVMRRVMNTGSGSKYFKHMGPKCRDEGSFVIEVINEGGGHMLEYASDRLKDDDAFVRSLILMDNDNDILRHASERLQHDIELWKLSIENDDDDRMSFAYCPDSIRFNHEILRDEIKKALTTNWLTGINFPWFSLRDLIEEKIDGINDMLLSWDNDHLRQESLAKLPDDLIISLIENSSTSCTFLFRELSHAQRSNKEIALAAVRTNDGNIDYVGDELKEDPDIICAFIRKSHSEAEKRGCGWDYAEYLSETKRQHPDVRALLEQLHTCLKRRRTS